MPANTKTDAETKTPFERLDDLLSELRKVLRDIADMEQQKGNVRHPHTHLHHALRHAIFSHDEIARARACGIAY